MTSKSIALKISRHTRPIFFSSRESLFARLRVNTSVHLSPHAGRNGLSSLAVRPIVGLRIPFVCLRQTRANQRCCYSSGESTPVTDPGRPDLFYHVLLPPTPISPTSPAFGLSFISMPPPSANSSAIIGWLPAASEREGQEAGLNDFKENRKSNSTPYMTILLSRSLRCEFYHAEKAF
jgi:hypothetical protein